MLSNFELAARRIRPQLPRSDGRMEHSVSSEGVSPPIFLPLVRSEVVRRTQCYSGEGTRHMLDIPQTTVVLWQTAVGGRAPVHCEGGGVGGVCG